MSKFVIGMGLWTFGVWLISCAMFEYQNEPYEAHTGKVYTLAELEAEVNREKSKSYKEGQQSVITTRRDGMWECQVVKEG